VDVLEFKGYGRVIYVLYIFLHSVILWLSLNNDGSFSPYLNLEFSRILLYIYFYVSIVILRSRDCAFSSTLIQGRFKGLEGQKQT